MAKIVLLFIIVAGFNFKLSTSTNLRCSYQTGDWTIVKNSYFCKVEDDPSITTKESATITTISSNHQSRKTNFDVDGFFARDKTLNYFPRDLETFFKNIKVIQFATCNLKEIHQEDLKPFSKLIQLSMDYNSLEVLEEGLLDFNPDLELVSFQSNKIIHIEPKIFDNLTKLKYLFLLSNTCISKYASNSISEVRSVIQAAKSQCVNSELNLLNEKLEVLQKDARLLSSEDYAEKLQLLGKTLKSSRFSSFRPLNTKFDALKKFEIERNVCKFNHDEISMLIDLKVKASEDRIMAKIEELLEKKSANV